ncbi:Eukaryotic/viral aspartic protease [Phytophthora megakarya]|uniref:Eukaryotic/viral aspartic protease n=1 Tax=Phytophthora megakarya TaxID=4795 RepID=A0A225VAF4_9STRA|nr:Eukaryotic/viral aspartic protease [Phytophthora megakarya]
MDNSQVDLIKVDSDLQLNLDRDSTIAAADAQVHDFVKCEAFDELAKILRTNVDKKNISPELQKLVFADLVIDAECVYAFIGKYKRPEDNNNNNNENEKNVEFNAECGLCLDGGTLHATTEDTTTKKLQLLPGERMGWWSSQIFDRRVRMRALVRGAVNDVRTSILLDTGANVTLGWNTVYEFEFWVMDHSAGSEVVLGTDFMIPAGIRLDLFNATAKLPGEEMVPLVKSLSADDDSAQGMHVTGGPTKSLQIPAGEWIELRLQKQGNDDPVDDDYAVHEANYISLEDYAQELAFLSDLTEPSVTELDYTAPNVKNPSFVGDQQRRLDEVLKKHEAIMIWSGNALPPPAYGVVCDIDVQGRRPS